MVYIHGGGFTFGSGDIKEYGPDFLVSHKIVLVTFNYRLGALGKSQYEAGFRYIFILF